MKKIILSWCYDIAECPKVDGEMNVSHSVVLGVYGTFLSSSLKICWVAFLIFLATGLVAKQKSYEDIDV